MKELNKYFPRDISNMILDYSDENHDKFQLVINDLLLMNRVYLYIMRIERSIPLCYPYFAREATILINQESIFDDNYDSNGCISHTPIEKLFYLKKYKYILCDSK